MNAIPPMASPKPDPVALNQYLEYLKSELERTQLALDQYNATALTMVAEPVVNSDPVATAQPSPALQEPSYREVVEDQLDLICRFDADYRLTFVNRPYADLYGKPPEALLGQSLLKDIPPAYQAQVIAHLAALDAQHPVAVDESPARLPDGSWRWFHWTNRLIEQPNGVIEYQGVGRDITERKQAEEAEREQRQLAEAMRDSLAALTSSLDVEQVMTQILASAATVVPSEAGSIILIEDDTVRVAYLRGFTPEASTLLKQQRFAIDTWPGIHRAFVHKTSYEYLDTRLAQEWIASPLTAWIFSSIGVPIECAGQMIGLLIADSATPNFFQPGDVDKLQAFAQYAGLALSNADYTRRLEQHVVERTTELQASEDKFRQLLQAAPVAIILSDQVGQIMLVNNQAERLFGYQRAELLGQPIELLVPETARAAHVGKRAVYTQNLQVRAMGSGLELFAQRKEGNLVPVEIQLSYLESADGLLVMSFILDITERKQAADALRRQHDFLQAVIDHIPDIITVQNRQGYVQLVNQYTAQCFDTTPAALVGKTISELALKPHEIARLGQLTDEVLTRQQALFVSDGRLGERDYQANLIPLAGASAADDQVLIVAADITERRAAEVALQKALETERELSELKSGFITTASHEFRTPLAIILSTIDTLRAYRHKLADAQINLRLERIADQVHHLTDMMENVFDLARMQARRVSFQPVPCNPATLCYELFAEFQNHFETQHQLLYTCATDLPAATLDERLLRQIVSNLLANAVKYSPADKVVRMNVAYRDGALVLTVRDEGIGIPADDMKHLFLPFQRAANVGNIPGTGLGLSIVKEATELHRGSITVESQLAVGTTVTVTLPGVAALP